MTKPFLKWAGGKRTLLPELRQRVPEFTGKYCEPFLGGGALYFYLEPERAVLSDSNAELMNAYRVVRDHPEALIAQLEVMPYRKDFYYAVREADRLPTWEKTNDTKRAARFIYLNKTGFNGLHRVNQKGQFNVPFGKYKNPTICDRKTLMAASAALQNVLLCTGNFSNALQALTEDDFVYLDPPYVPLNAASFTSYTADGFGEPQQLALATLCRRLDTRGVKFLLSNSDTPLSREMYGRFKVEQVNAPRNINSKGGERGKVGEILVSNY